MSVADFVAPDRGLKRLALRLMRDLVEVTENHEAPADAPTVKASATLRTGLSILFASGSRILKVTHEDDSATVLGTVTIEQLQDAVYDTAPKAPTAVVTAGEA